MKKFIKENWFKILIIILLLMIYSRLEVIKSNTFYAADMVDNTGRKIINSIDSRLQSIELQLDSIGRSY